MDADVVIVGAGLSGLACARRLVEIGRTFVILEASDAVGGRVRTDIVDGFRLDRGFHFLLTAYPEARRHFDYLDLKLKRFSRTVLIRNQGQFQRLADPRNHPVTAAKSLVCSIGTAGDMFKLLELEARLRRNDPERLFEEPEGLTLDLLRWHGFTERMIDRFFRPIFGAMLLERDLVTSSRLFRFLFRMLADGDVAVPESGMGALPEQLASHLPAGSIRFDSDVVAVEPGQVRLQNGQVFNAEAIVVATDETTAAKLLHWPAPKPGRAMTCIYYTAPRSPIGEPVIVFDADESGPVNHFVVLSDVSPSYAPNSQSLISLTALGNCVDDDAVRKQMTDWYGPQVDQWRHLQTYRIPFAIPDQTAPGLDPARKPARVSPGLYVCGDHRADATINGALLSGWRAAQAVAEDLANG